MVPIHILHVEDEPDDRFLVKRAFQQAGPEWLIHPVCDGDLAMDYLSGGGEHADRTQYPLPHLVLLDLQLPTVHGLDLLAWIRAQDRFRRLLVVVLSGSPGAADDLCALELGATAFFEKTPLYANVVEFVADLFNPNFAPSSPGARARRFELDAVRATSPPPLMR